MKSMFVALSVLISASAFAGANDGQRHPEPGNYAQYSCLQLAVLNEVLLSGARDSQSVTQVSETQLAYLATSAAKERPSLKTAFMEQAQAVYQTYLEKQCLAE